MQQYRLDVLGAFHGAPQTVDLIKRYALEAQGSPQVRLLAEEIIFGLDSKDSLSEILALYYYVLSNTRYANDPRTVELVKRPDVVVQSILAGHVPSLDCDDLATILAALCLSIGREVRVVTVAFKDIRYRGQKQYSHVFIQVREPRTNRWVAVDPVAAEDTGKMIQRVKIVKIWAIA